MSVLEYLEQIQFELGISFKQACCKLQHDILSVQIGQSKLKLQRTEVKECL